MTVEERVREVIEVVSTLPEDADLSCPLEELYLDSLDVTDLVLMLEEEFADEKLKVVDDVVSGWVTFGDIVRYVEQNTAR
jgi:acyl carrier protein